MNVDRWPKRKAVSQLEQTMRSLRMWRDRRNGIINECIAVVEGFHPYRPDLMRELQNLKDKGEKG